MYRIFLLLIAVSIVLFGCRNNPPLATTEYDWAFHDIRKIDDLNPILSPDSTMVFMDPVTGRAVRWESRNVLNPTAVVRHDSVFLLYRAQDATGTSRVGLAVSTDGQRFTKMPTPLFYPDKDAQLPLEWNHRKLSGDTLEACQSCYFDGVEDPRLVESEDGTYVMTYTAYDGKTARLALATSRDLRKWTKHGLVLKGDKYKDRWSKSGAIVSRLEGSRIVATKIQGKYWMYFGDTQLFMATSDDLVHWEPVENQESGNLIAVLHPRPGFFDSRLVEPGPFALLTPRGIVLIYNASNAANYNDPTLPVFTYAAGQALFEADAPYQLKARTPSHFIHPNKPYEREGEVNEVCFVEGMVFFKGQWLLYYGTADSKIAVAVGESPAL